MSIQDGKFEVYYIGLEENYINTNYIKDILEKNNFNMCKNIENADFILDTEEFLNSADWIKAMDYAKIDYIDVAKNLDDLLRLRDEYQFREI
jgi:hypothetical protein